MKDLIGHYNLKGKKVFVAMSGGVDSFRCPALLKDQGCDVVGVTMCFGSIQEGVDIKKNESSRPLCCGIEGINDAKRVAGILGIPHYVLNFGNVIEEAIIEDFIQEYLSGRTPNPCVRCNQLVKFGVLLEKVRALGADYLATGHYADIVGNEEKKEYSLCKAVDPQKDQSYFLYGIKKEDLPYILFPLGKEHKKNVRDIARQYQLNIAEKKDSQDICFVPDRDYKRFVEERVGKKMLTPGDFVNEKGEVVGRHQGIAHYTIGQREKLGIALGFPVYVYRIDKETNTVFVGSSEKLLAKGLQAKDLNWLGGDFPKESLEVQARIRYNASDVEARIMFLEDKKVNVTFKEPQKSVTPGQSVVFYQNNIVLGGAIIDQSII